MQRAAFILLIICLIPGCASIFSSESQDVAITTLDGKEIKAIVTQGGDAQNVSLPATIPVKRDGKKVKIVIREQDNPCYRASEHEVSLSFNKFVLLNITGLWFSELSTITDFVTGRIWSYDDTTLVTLPKENADCR